MFENWADAALSFADTLSRRLPVELALSVIVTFHVRLSTRVIVTPQSRIPGW